MNYIWILVPIIDADPHLEQLKYTVSVIETNHKVYEFGGCVSRGLERTFLKVLRPARILPPIHVLYFRSGGAKILILMSLTANR